MNVYLSDDCPFVLMIMLLLGLVLDWKFPICTYIVCTLLFEKVVLLCCVIAVAILQYSCVCLVIFGVFCCAARRFVRHSFISLEILGFR